MTAAAESLSRVWLSATPWTAARQAPLSVGFSMQEYWSGWPCPLPGDLPDPEIKPRSPALQADCLRLSHQGSPSDLTALCLCSAACGACFVIQTHLTLEKTDQRGSHLPRPHAGGRQPQARKPWAPLLWGGGRQGPLTALICPVILVTHHVMLSQPFKCHHHSRPRPRATCRVYGSRPVFLPPASSSPLFTLW